MTKRGEWRAASIPERIMIVAGGVMVFGFLFFVAALLVAVWTDWAAIAVKAVWTWGIITAAATAAGMLASIADDD